MRKVCVADLDRSGRSAVVAMSIKEKAIAVSRLESGRLSFPKPLAISGDPVAMDLADMDGDGTMDLVYVAKSAGKYYVRTLLNVGAPEPKAGPELQTDLKDNPPDIRAVDADHDGRMDVLILTAYGSPMLVQQPQPGKLELSTVSSGLLTGIEPGADHRPAGTGPLAGPAGGAEDLRPLAPPGQGQGLAGDRPVPAG